jgi:hypothetical protein
MSDAKSELAKFGLTAPDILIPNKNVDMNTWAVVACDQYTSEPEYWESVADYVSGRPSTLNMIYPECYLEREDPDQRIASIIKHMNDYLEHGIFDEYPGTFFLVHRKTAEDKPGRWGLIAAVDLEAYDYSEDSTSLIRATEGTILSRIPPRKAIRKNAPLEFPHILILLDDPNRTLIESLAGRKESFKKVYETKLMKNSGAVSAYAVASESDHAAIASALSKLADKQAFKKRYGSEDVLLFAMGDGNHSLATAKSCWEDMKKDLSGEEIQNHRARYALVEIENIYDEGIEFEPIHRVLFNAEQDAFLETLSHHCSSFKLTQAESLDWLYERIHVEDERLLYFGMIDDSGKLHLVTLEGSDAQIAAGTLQHTIDEYLENSGASVDYTHGLSVTYELGKKPGNIGIFLPAIRKDEFFGSIIADGALPRKTFSMGEDFEKRFYIEGRKIR